MNGQQLFKILLKEFHEELGRNITLEEQSFLQWICEVHHLHEAGLPKQP